MEARGTTHGREGEDTSISGETLSEVTSAIVQLHRRFYGRGPTKARATCADDVLTVVLEHIPTTVERTLIEHGHAGLVIQVRMTFEEAVRAEFAAAVERVVGRKVASFTSGIDIERGVASETYILAPPESPGRLPASRLEQDARAG